MSPGSERPRLASVAVPVPTRRLFVYAVPDDLVERVRTGCRVRVPFGPRRMVGTVVEWPAAHPGEGIEIRAVTDVLDRGPAVEPDILALTRFVSDYYLCSWGSAIEAALPPDPGPAARRFMVRRSRGVDPESVPARATARRRVLRALPADGSAMPLGKLPVRDRSVARQLARLDLVRIDEDTGPPAEPAAGSQSRADPQLVPTPAQNAALDRIFPALETGAFAPFLLFGATGSGKTEVYLRAARAALDAGKGVLYLVPEIGLTPLLMGELKRRFGDAVTVLHSALGKRQRFDAWQGVRHGRCRFVVGTRSAVFAPLAGLGLVIVDEEHDGSYKQDETPRYNGRDLAVLRARESGAVAVLGSATPSLESFQNCRSGRYEMIRLGGRVEDRPMPAVELVDMREEFRRHNEIRPLSSVLRTALERCLERGEQALVLRNRRGWSVAVFCPACGNRVLCADCSVAMTWHKNAGKLRCHTCFRELPTPRLCPHCGSDDLRFLGEGAERVEDELRRVLPGARIARMDRDTVRHRGAHEALLRTFARGEIDVMVGTQMIAKGHDFPRVTLVGVLSADQSLGLADFRAGERTFQLLTQVAGRAGRGERPGKVVLQAFDPSHSVLRLAVAQDYDAFFEREAEYRRILRFPPFSSMVQLLVTDSNPGKAAVRAEILAQAVRDEGARRLIVVGPGPAPVERIRQKYRYQVLVRSAGRRRLVRAVDRALTAVEGKIPLRSVVVDVDPYSLL